MEKEVGDLEERGKENNGVVNGEENMEANLEEEERVSGRAILEAPESGVDQMVGEAAKVR